VCVTQDELVAYVAVFGGIALFTVVLTLVAVRVRRAGNAKSLARRASQVATEVRELLVGPEFLWRVWHDTARAREMKMLIRNQRDEIVSTVTVPSLPLDGVLRRFELDGRHYEIRNPGLTSTSTWLCEAGGNEVLLSTKESTFSITFFHGDRAKELFTLPTASVLERFRPVEVDGREIGRLIVGLDGDAAVCVLTLPQGRHSMLEQVFVLASV
jgi:hypothetical protein